MLTSELERTIKEKKKELEEMEKRLETQKVLICLLFEKFADYLKGKGVFDKDTKQRDIERIAKSAIDRFLSLMEKLNISQGATLLNSFEYIHMMQESKISHDIMMTKLWE